MREVTSVVWLHSDVPRVCESLGSRWYYGDLNHNGMVAVILPSPVGIKPYSRFGVESGVQSALLNLDTRFLNGQASLFIARVLRFQDL